MTVSPIRACHRVLAVVGGGMLLLAGCQVTPVPGTGRVEPLPTVSGPPPATTIPLGQDDAATSPWDYIAAARNAASPERERLILDAVELFLDLRQVSTAQSLLEQMRADTLPTPMAVRHRLLAARTLLLAGQPQQAVRSLDGIAGAGLDRAAVSEILRLRGEALVAMNAVERGIADLSRRQDYLDDDEARLQSNRRIWEILQNRPLDELTRIRDQGAAGDRVVRGWADLVLTTAASSWDPRAMARGLQRWAQLHPDHPAAARLVPELVETLTARLREYRRIALLLPMTSDFGAAARAVRDGIVALHGADSNPRKPQLILYDVGGDPSQVPFYYQAAIRDGVDFVIGPLGKAAADALARATEAQVPTLLLGNPEPGTGVRGPYYQFSLAPELEAEAVAERAFADGHRVAAILAADSERGRSIAAAMTARWQELGGQVAARRDFAPEAGDHSQAIQLLLDIHESQGRARRIEALIGQAIAFEPRRRHDIDAILLVADAGQARLVKPQLDFYKAHDLPVYATSEVYTGRPDPVNDLDLEGIVFGDMPWMLSDSGRFSLVRSTLPTADSYRQSPLDRLFALGLDAYSLVPRLEQLAGASYLRHPGFTGVLTVSPGGVIRRDLVWARFEEARPVPLPGAGTSVTDKESGNGRQEAAAPARWLLGRGGRPPLSG